MKHYFVWKQQHSCLTIFLAGWGMDEHPFLDYQPQNSDLLVCYDYRTLDWDWSLCNGYRNIRVVAWSMGVWAASQLFRQTLLPVSEYVAVNGTPFPVDDERGIPLSIFNGTLQGLNDSTLRKFFRRMCGSAGSLNTFLKHSPQRPIDELKEELAHIGTLAATLPPSDLVWNKVFIGSDDLIFTAINQRHAWNGLTEKVMECVAAHYDSKWLRAIVCNRDTYGENS